MYLTGIVQQWINVTLMKIVVTEDHLIGNKADQSWEFANMMPILEQGIARYLLLILIPNMDKQK